MRYEDFKNVIEVSFKGVEPANVNISALCHPWHRCLHVWSSLEAIVFLELKHGYLYSLMY